MRRGVVIGWSVLGGLCLAMAVALAVIGSRYDSMRLELDEQQADADDLEAEQETWWTERDTLAGERDALKAERDTLSQRVDEHLKTIEQLKAELERARQASAATAGGPSSTP